MSASARTSVSPIIQLRSWCTMASRPPKTRRKPKNPKTKAETPAGRASPDSLQAYIRGLARFEPLTREQERELGEQIQAGDPSALNRLVECNLRFVVAYAKRFRSGGFSFLDLIHEGNLGLIEAARRFDPTRGVRFISYAVWWIRQAMIHALSTQGRAYHVPIKRSALAARLQNTRDQMTSTLERIPTNEELSAETNVSADEIAALQRATGPNISLSTSLSDDDSVALADTLQQDGVASVELELVRASLVRLTHEMLADLDEKERQVIGLRFGLDGEEPRTLQEIGDQLGVSRERVRQIESRAKDKLRRTRQAQSIRGYLN
jgi:RNA polymerase primary sigma factor